jgi:uncharacterized protein YyaL (SSP411 family)
MWSLVRRLIIIPLCLRALLPGTVAAEEETPRAQIEWREWSDEIFAQAKKENRFVLLDLEAVWCHWCHVMDEITYRDPKVIELINTRYIAVKVDQDSRPDLSARYEDYGWPATVVFNIDGSEIVKRQGYIPPMPMASMLQAIIDDPSPGPSILPETPIEPTKDAALSPNERDKLQKILRDRYDPKNKGWGTEQKFLSWDIIEYSLREANRGDAAFGKMAHETLDAQRQLIDPVWGGVYQYSTDGDWKHPHFEKIMQMQAENLRIYAEAYALWKNPADLKSAQKIRDYLRNFLTNPDGAFYTSHDADLKPGEHSADYFALGDAARLKRGIPRIDQHIYARENGWAINALAKFYAVTGDESALTDAVRAAQWVLTERALPDGGFRHDAENSGGPYLSDTVSMARAFLQLYAVTGDRVWLKRADDAMMFIAANFNSAAGYISFAQPIASTLIPRPNVDENVAVARITNLLSYYTKNPKFHAMAEHAMKFLGAPAVCENCGYEVAGILLAAEEVTTPPLHITIVGAKNDAAARRLFQTAIAQPSTYKRVEWWDRKEGPLPNPDVDYPDVGKAAAFLCTDRSCSAPIFDPARISSFGKPRKK